MKRTTRYGLHWVFAFILFMPICSTKGEERNLPLCSTADGNYDKLFSIPENSRDGTYIGRLDVVTETFDRNRRGKLDMRRTEQMCGKVPCVEWIKFDPSSQNLTLSIRPQDVLDREGEWGVEHIDLVFVCRVISNEQEASYSVTITASINVADIDDNDPVFVGEPYRVGVSEFTAIGRSIINITATDPDRFSHLSYRVLPNQLASDYFEIHRAMSGEVKLRKKLDYESLATLNQTLMSLEIEVVSRGRLGDPTETRRKRTKVTIRVLDEDDQAPVFDHCGKTADDCVLPEYKTCVRENTLMKRALVLKPAQLLAYDPDAQIRQSIVYSIMRAEPPSFEEYFFLYPSTGEIFLQRKLQRSDKERERPLYIKACQQDNRDMCSAAKVVVKVVKNANDRFPPAIEKTHVWGYVDANDHDSEVTFVRSARGTSLKLSVRDEDYSDDDQPEFELQLDPNNGLFEITRQGYFIGYVHKIKESNKQTYEVRVVAENLDFCSEENRYSDPFNMKIQINWVQSRISARNGNSTTGNQDQPDEPDEPDDQTFVALFGVFLGLFIICVPIIVYLAVKMRRYREMSYRTPREPYAMKESFGQRYDAFSFNNSAYRDHAESFSSSNRTVVSRKALSNPIASVGNVIATPPIDDEVPHIAPLEAIKTKKFDESEEVSNITPYRSDSPGNQKWLPDVVEETLTIDQIRVENWLSETKEKKCGVGEVNLGSPRPCFVKILTGFFPNKDAASRDTSAMQQVLHYRVCRHPNIVRFYGCCFHKNSLYIVNEFISSRDLRTVLVSSRMQEHSAVISTLSGTQLLSFVIGVAQGMIYLHDNGVVHATLCADNVRVNDSLTAKLSECCSESALRYKLKSKRWAAPEVISNGQYSPKSDVWSFAVLVWEIVSLGGVPFHDLAESLVPNHVMRLLRSGSSLLPVTRNTTKRLWLLLQKCWAEDELDRPDFQAIKTALSAMRTASNAITVAKAPGYRFFPTTVAQQEGVE